MYDQVMEVPPWLKVEWRATGPAQGSMTLTRHSQNTNDFEKGSAQRSVQLPSAEFEIPPQDRVLAIRDDR